MKFQVIPLIYAANEQFKNTIRFAVEFHENISPDALEYAVSQVQKRYPYYSVKIEREGEGFVLAENSAPFVINADEKPVCLNSEASSLHLLAFAWKERTIWADISHFICDGNGLVPMIKTLVYYYVEKRYGSNGIDTDGIRLVTDVIPEEEYAFPFPDTPIPNNNSLSIPKKTYEPFLFEDGLFDGNGSYAYNLQVSQQELMKYAKSNDGSPVSFICVMLYKALMKLYPEINRDIVFTIPHEYRKALRRPLSHDCLARVLNVNIAADKRDMPLELLNTGVRGQIILGSDESADIDAINGMVQMNAYMQSLPLEEKTRTILGLISKGALVKNTFGVSYSGNFGWNGMEKYIRDIHGYAGERTRHQTISVEVFTIGESFSLCLMQPGKNPVFMQELIRCFGSCGIDCRLMSEERFHLADYELP
ncbi:MAG: hypothetical protein J5966_03970 [Lachnospiraceae bacterium]|nr:hypothetical protein [Lachnospiraceae bacterium]